MLSSRCQLCCPSWVLQCVHSAWDKSQLLSAGLVRPLTCPTPSFVSRSTLTGPLHRLGPLSRTPAPSPLQSEPALASHRVCGTPIHDHNTIIICVFIASCLNCELRESCQVYGAHPARACLVGREESLVSPTSASPGSPCRGWARQRSTLDEKQEPAVQLQPLWGRC